MIVAIDAGNTRIKWGLHDGGLHDGAGWVARGALPTADAARLAEAAAGWPIDARIVVCNVAGAGVAQQIDAALAGRDIVRFAATAACCGVVNGYDDPARLGADRWAALVGARARVAGACLVVCAGTATTIDALAPDGRFAGGVILPGYDLMRQALAGNTAQLPLADGAYRELPRNTLDAIASGCLDAQAGAIERRYAALAAAFPAAACVVTGGGAERLLPQLSIAARCEENLILDGLVRYALSLT